MSAKRAGVSAMGCLPRGCLPGLSTEGFAMGSARVVCRACLDGWLSTWEVSAQGLGMSAGGGLSAQGDSGICLRGVWINLSVQ